MLDLDAFPAIASRLGALLDDMVNLGAREVWERYGWIAREIWEGGHGFWKADDYQMLDHCLRMVPRDYPAHRLLTQDGVDSAFAELLVSCGLIRRFGDEVQLEKNENDKGRVPDLVLSNSKVVFEIRSLGSWGPSQLVKRVENTLRTKLQTSRTHGHVRIRLSEPVTIEDPQDLASKIADLIEVSYRKQSSNRFEIPVPRKERSRQSPYMEVKYRFGGELSVCSGPIAVVPVTGKAAAEFADEHNTQIGAVSSYPAGKSMVDHVRNAIRKKANRQLIKGWTNFVILVQSVNSEPMVPWDLVLRDALEGDSILQMQVDDSTKFSELVLGNSGAWRGNQNTRLSGAMGITIDIYGKALEIKSHVREGVHLSRTVRQFLSVDRPLSQTECSRLHQLLGG